MKGFKKVKYKLTIPKKTLPQKDNVFLRPKNKFVMLAYYIICHYFYIKLYASIANLLKQWHSNIHVVTSTLC
ncbi:hypothetical protein LV89_03533 [Arcicella aurantiaca]|uniref:Uncharacterized protein n=1 Tax=Arcicella aurantiaca TaxID=591202 RepID=A0A316DXB8_9BACT|nr:hypothetical protein LV89_03533 [Arcicella aurantiaca]